MSFPPYTITRLSQDVSFAPCEKGHILGVYKDNLIGTASIVEICYQLNGSKVAHFAIAQVEEVLRKGNSLGLKVRFFEKIPKEDGHAMILLQKEHIVPIESVNRIFSR